MNVSSKENYDMVATLQLQDLLQQYGQLFDEPTSLPPHRGHDHQISLKDNTQVVKIRPYRYPPIQKDEI